MLSTARRSSRNSKHSRKKDQRSPLKIFCHNRLISFLQKFGRNAFQRMHTKDQLMHISQAYGIRTTSRSNKTTLATKLIPVIQSCGSVLSPCFLDNFCVQTSADDNSQRVVLRISRQNFLVLVSWANPFL